MSNQSAVNGTLILVLGILSLVVCQVLGPVAWIMGNNALRALDQGGGDPSQRTLANVGRICGIIATALLILGIILYFTVGLAFLGFSRTGARPVP